jgi:hypothetical protein
VPFVTMSELTTLIAVSVVILPISSWLITKLPVIEVAAEVEPLTFFIYLVKVTG